LWIINLNDKLWFNIGEKFVKKEPEKMHQHTGEIVDRHGKIVFFGGKNISEKKVTLLNLNVLYDIYSSLLDPLINEKNQLKQDLWSFIDVSSKFYY